jgi:ATP adenylyltransferase/5',5'''-P-1,P-4-tetraphosphate phosphorylase II
VAAGIQSHLENCLLEFISSMIKKIEKDFFDQNHQKMKIINPELFEEYKKEFGINKKYKINKNDI